MNYLVVRDGVAPIKDRIVGYHEKKRVVTQFYYSVRYAEPDTKFILMKCKQNALETIDGYWDYYLIRYGRNYVPTKYYEIVKEDIETLLCEYRFTIEILQRQLECEELKKSDRDAVKRVMKLLTEDIDEQLDCCISPTELKRREDSYNEFKYHIYDSNLKEVSKAEWIPFI